MSSTHLREDLDELAKTNLKIRAELAKAINEIALLSEHQQIDKYYKQMQAIYDGEPYAK